MSEIHVCAVITPTSGKEDRVRELLSNLAAKVKQLENDVVRYQLFEQYDSKSGTNVFIVQETYKDKAAYDSHFTTEHFTALAQTIPKEGLLGKELEIMTIKPIAGFASR